MKRTERERIERVVDQIASIVGVEFRPEDSKPIVQLILRELANKRARVRRIVRAQESVSGGFIDKAKLLAALSGRRGKR